ncbi:hypothetical protein [Pelagibacterium sp.]|uniref:hypothetical protein n=1 Tax=Pelagibacterium sp. TaxID=1967288 RepID=UPI003BACE2A5
MKDKITVRIPPELAEAFKIFIEKPPVSIQTRQDGLRYILHDWLHVHGYLDLPSETKNGAGRIVANSH